MKEKYIPLRILNEDEKKEIVDKLNEQFGIEEVPGIILSRGKERLFLFQGELTKKDIKNIEENIQVERVGVYFAKILDDATGEKVRLSIEGVQILKNQIKKNIFSLSYEQAEQWMKGQDLLLSTGKRELFVMEYQGIFLGCGKASESKIGNFVPKNRRLREKS